MTSCLDNSFWLIMINKHNPNVVYQLNEGCMETFPLIAQNVCAYNELRQKNGCCAWSPLNQGGGEDFL